MEQYMGFLVSGTSGHGMPLINILLGLSNMRLILREVVDCIGHMSEGGQNDALFFGPRLAIALLSFVMKSS